MALELAEARFVGIDLSSRQIAEGRSVVERLGLRNLNLRAISIMDVDRRLGNFDYIICHGVYSWVPEPVRDKILAICAESLAPDGIAYVSYNTYPGWRARDDPGADGLPRPADDWGPRARPAGARFPR
jgi:SAM-dependent methyltransferase